MKIVTKAKLYMLANQYAMHYIACKVGDPNNKEYSKDRLIHRIKTEHGVKSFVLLWYWARVYKEFVRYYDEHVVDLMGEGPYEVYERNCNEDDTK